MKDLSFELRYALRDPISNNWLYERSRQLFYRRGVGRALRKNEKHFLLQLELFFMPKILVIAFKKLKKTRPGVEIGRGFFVILHFNILIPRTDLRTEVLSSHIIDTSILSTHVLLYYAMIMRIYVTKLCYYWFKRHLPKDFSRV